MRLRYIAATACLLLSFAAIAQSDDPNRRTIEAIQQALSARPNDPTLYYYLAGYQVQVGDKAAAWQSLAKVAEIGDGFLPTGFVGFDRVWTDPEFRKLYNLLESKLPKIDDAPVAFEIADKDLIPEGIAWDPASGHFYIGSVAKKSIVRMDAKGKLTQFSGKKDGLQHVLGIAVDGKRRLLHAVSTSALTEEGRKQAVNAIVTYDLTNGAKRSTVTVEKTEQLNDVAVAPNGDLYTTDSSAGAIWRIRGGRVQTFLPPGQARGTNGVAVSDDGKSVYVAHSTGIARIDSVTAKMERMLPPPRETVAAVDGLYYYRGDLLGVQNVTNPGRVIRMKLSGDGTDILAVETLQSHHHPAFDEPTTAVVANNALYVLATTQVARFNDKGELEKPEMAKSPKVVKIPLRR